MVADVTDPAQVADAVTLGLQYGPLAAVVSAAGILEPGELHEITDQSWQWHLAVNTTGVLNLLQASAPQLRDHGSIVVVSSNAARVPRVGMAAYAASKAATSALTRCVGLELAHRGIRCNVVEPGSTDTAMQRALWPDVTEGQMAAWGGATQD